MPVPQLFPANLVTKAKVKSAINIFRYFASEGARRFSYQILPSVTAFFATPCANRWGHGPRQTLEFSLCYPRLENGTGACGRKSLPLRCATHVPKFPEAVEKTIEGTSFVPIEPIAPDSALAANTKEEDIRHGSLFFYRVGADLR